MAQIMISCFDKSTIMAQQRCKVDGYHDPRPRLTDEQLMEIES